MKTLLITLMLALAMPVYADEECPPVKGTWTIRFGFGASAATYHYLGTMRLYENEVSIDAHQVSHYGQVVEPEGGVHWGGTWARSWDCGIVVTIPPDYPDWTPEQFVFYWTGKRRLWLTYTGGDLGGAGTGEAYRTWFLEP